MLPTVHQTQEEFDEFITNCKGLIGKILSGGVKDFPPAMLMSAKADDGKGGLVTEFLVYPVMGMPETFGQKVALMEEMGREVARQKKAPTIACIVTETWSVLQHKDEPRPPCMPVDHPQRQEKLMIFGRSIDKKHSILAEMPIKRHIDNTIIAGDLIDMTDLKAASMPLVDSIYYGVLMQFIEERPHLKAMMEKHKAGLN